MSGDPTHRKLWRDRNVNALAYKIEQEAREIVPAALHQDRRSAKVIALRTGATPRAVEHWRQHQSMPRLPHFIALAREIPELKAAVLRWLDAEAEIDPETDRLMVEIAQAVQKHMGKR